MRASHHFDHIVELQIIAYVLNRIPKFSDDELDSLIIFFNTYEINIQVITEEENRVKGVLVRKWLSNPKKIEEVHLIELIKAIYNHYLSKEEKLILIRRGVDVFRMFKDYMKQLFVDSLEVNKTRM